MSKSKKSSKNLKRPALNQSKHLNREWLETKYITEGLSTYQIAAIVSRNPKNIYDKLKLFGIPTRTRAEVVQANAWWRDGRPSANIGKKVSEKTKQLLRSKALGRPGLIGKRNPMYGKRGSLHPNWQGGNTPERQKIYSTLEWKALVKYIYARDNYTCQRCHGSSRYSNRLHAHHLKSWTRYPKLRTEPSNLITVCRECHQWIHSNKNTKKEFIA